VQRQLRLQWPRRRPRHSLPEWSPEAPPRWRSAEEEEEGDDDDNDDDGGGADGKMTSVHSAVTYAAKSAYRGSGDGANDGTDDESGAATLNCAPGRAAAAVAVRGRWLEGNGDAAKVVQRRGKQKHRLRPTRGRRVVIVRDGSGAAQCTSAAACVHPLGLLFGTARCTGRRERAMNLPPVAERSQMLRGGRSLPHSR